MVVRKKFNMMDVITRILIMPNAGAIESRGNMIRLVINMPRGGIHDVFRISVMVKDDFDTYSTQPLQKIVRKMLRMGVIMQPKRGNSEKDGKKMASAKLQRVIITL